MSRPELPEDEVFFAAVGRLAIAWAQIEGGLDYAIKIIHLSAGGDTIEPEIPWALQRKLRYLRKCAKKLAPLQAFQKEAESLAAKIETASVLRHDILHGFVVDPPDDAGFAKMIRLLRGEDKPDKTFSIDAKQIRAGAEETLGIGEETVAFTQALADKFLPKPDAQDAAQAP
jgi:hypothetical protein